MLAMMMNPMITARLARIISLPLRTSTMSKKGGWPVILSRGPPIQAKKIPPKKPPICPMLSILVVDMNP